MYIYTHIHTVRLLKKSKSLKPIVDALFASVLPVCNSMVSACEDTPRVLAKTRLECLRRHA